MRAIQIAVAVAVVALSCAPDRHLLVDPPLDGRIAFLDVRVLKTIAPDGTDLRVLPSSWSFEFEWSPDGTQIAYECREDDYRICIIEARGKSGGVVELATGGSAANMHWSPDGSQLAFTRLTNRPNGVFVIDVAGASKPRALTSDEDGCPRWSPDGQRLLFLRGSTQRYNCNLLYLIAESGGEPERIAEHCVEHPRWSPDGRFIAYVVESVDVEGLFSIDVDSGATTQLVAERVWDPEWSPGGSEIVYKYGAYNNSPWTISKVSAKGGTPERLTKVEGSRPQWSPDGNWVIYSADVEDEETFDVESYIFRIPAFGGPPVRLAKGIFPKWSAEAK